MGSDVEARAHVALIKHALGSFQRHFAGRPHEACDQAHLRELIQRLGPGQRQDLLTRLLQEMEAAEPSSPTERANHLALLANQQFSLYTRHIAGQPRASRRLALVERIVSNLRGIADELRSLALSPKAARNLELIERQRARFEADAAEIASEREATSPSQLVRLLAAAANVEIAAYQRDFEGRDRDLVDLDRLAGMCDRMGEVVYQMVEVLPALTEEQDLALATDNVTIASAHLDRFEVEHNAIAERRKQFITLAHVVESATALRGELLAADASEQVRLEAVARLDALMSDPVVREIIERPSRP